MEIRIEPHTLKRARERGVSREQIEDVLRTGQLSPAQLLTLEYRKTA